MKPSFKLDLLFHPVSLQILQAVNAGRQITAHQIAQACPTIPHATLYRYLSQLVEAGLLTIVEQRQTHNITERVYALMEQHTVLAGDEVAHISPQDWFRYFSAFIGMVLSNFKEYIESRKDREKLDIAADGFFFAGEFLALSDQEVKHLESQLSELLEPFQNRLPDAEHPLRLFAYTMLPIVKNPPPSADQEKT